MFIHFKVGILFAAFVVVHHHLHVGQFPAQIQMRHDVISGGKVS